MDRAVASIRVNSTVEKFIGRSQQPQPVLAGGGAAGLADGEVVVVLAVSPSLLQDESGVSIGQSSSLFERGRGERKRNLKF